MFLFGVEGVLVVAWFRYWVVQGLWRRGIGPGGGVDMWRVVAFVPGVHDIEHDSLLEFEFAVFAFGVFPFVVLDELAGEQPQLCQAVILHRLQFKL
jgi:hypothetical protein